MVAAPQVEAPIRRQFPIRIAQRMSEFVTFFMLDRCVLSVLARETHSQVTQNTFLITCGDPGLPERVTRARAAGLPFVQVTTVSVTRRVSMQARIRVVVAKPGLDGHDRGAKVVARALRDAGMEVIYTGLHQTPEQIVETAIQEDANAIGLSVLSGAHMTLFRRVIDLLAERDASDIVVFGGGIIPQDDITELESLGVARIFTPGATTASIIQWVRANVGSPVA
jgi:methylmalonyl-CoA mutase C-terminal domain/subunit